MRWGIVLAVLVLAGCASPDAVDVAPTPEPLAHAQRATIRTSAGEIVLELAREQAPAAVDHFVALAASGFYDGTRFHRSWQSTLIQGGDANSRSEDRATWGYGGQEIVAPVEFNPTLRHDTKGVASFASKNGGSQFFLTLAPKPDLDDRFPVFARVAGGMDVVERIAAAPNVGDAIDGHPVAPVVIESIAVSEPDISIVQHAVAVVPLATTGLPGLGSEKTVAPGETATFAVVVRSLGNVRGNFTLAAQHGAGWAVAIERERVELASGMGTVVLVEVTPPRDPPNEVVSLVVAPEGDPARAGTFPLVVHVAELGARPPPSARVRIDYALVTADGRLVDSTLERFDRANVIPPLRALGPRATYAPYEFKLGDGSALPAVDALVSRLRVGEADVIRVPAAEGYPDELLRGRDLVFEARLVEILG